MKRSLLMLIVFSLCGFFTLGAGVQQFSSEYRVGPKDLLEIKVFGIDELNQTVRVSEEGKISLPLLGEIEVEGLTQNGLVLKLEELLKEKYLQDPKVSIFIREYQSKRVSVLGAIRTPGPIEILGRQTLLQVISEAGGLTNEAGSDIIVIRQLADGSSTSLKISIDDLILRGDPTLNIPLQPGDIVNVPVDKQVYIYVFGQVKSPGALQVKMSNIPTLLQAIAQAGGFGERASKGSVLIKRVDENGKETQIKVNAKDIIKGKIRDIQLLENDTIYVPESIF
jgi:polysaccharide biosynthesis/export protein